MRAEVRELGLGDEAIGVEVVDRQPGVVLLDQHERRTRNEPAVGNTAGDGVKHGACGILGGEDGLPHRYTLYSGNEPSRAIKTKETGLVIHPGDRLVLESGGGGGWGGPAKRDPAATDSDVENGFVSRGEG